MIRGKTKTEEEDEIVGQFKVGFYFTQRHYLRFTLKNIVFNHFFKGSFKIYPIPDNTDIVRHNFFFNNVKQVLKEECIVRIYIVRGIDLQAKDSNGKVKYLMYHLKTFSSTLNF